MIRTQRRPSKEYGQEDFDLMEHNLMNIKRQITEEAEQGFECPPEDYDSPQRSHSTSHQYKSPEPITSRTRLEVIRHEYECYLSKGDLPSNHEAKIVHLLEEDLSIGNAIALFEMLYYFREALSEEVLAQMQEQAFEGMVGATQVEEVRCYGELVAECGVQDQAVCQYCVTGLLESTIDFNLAMLILTNQGQTGLVYLLDLAYRDISGLSSKLLDFLCKTDRIIKQLLIPQLIDEATTSTQPKARDIALAALNRLGPLTTRQHIQQLFSLIQDPAVDKKLLFAAIRSGGLKGQLLLLDIIQSKMYSEAIDSLILSVLSWRVPSQPALRIKVIEYTLENCLVPGRLYQYEGELQPWSYQSQTCTASLCLNSREFITQLDLLLKKGTFKVSPSTTNRDIFQLVEILSLEQEEKVQISEEVIRVLTHQLKSKSTRVRQIALIELGNIGYPESQSAIEGVTRCLWDPDCSIRSAACWTISRVCQQSSKRLQSRLNELLRDNFWKVRTSACLALGLVIAKPQLLTIQALIKTLQDGSIPKPTVCEALARMGAEELLLEILKGSTRNDFKLREAIVASFQLTNLQSPFLNAIIEELLRHARDQRIETRQLCLVTLNSLKRRVRDEGSQSISYFQSNNLLPFYYCFLEDPSSRIRKLASDNILGYGAQSELVFIEGMTKGQALTKIECIRSLGQLGVQNFRAIVLGLRDEDERVQRAAVHTIMTRFTSEQIIEEFSSKANQSISLLCNLKEILKGKFKNEELRSMMRQVIQGLQNSKEGGAFTLIRDENRRIN